jgi:hypothetical protein
VQRVEVLLKESEGFVQAGTTEAFLHVKVVFACEQRLSENTSNARATMTVSTSRGIPAYALNSTRGR